MTDLEDLYREIILDHYRSPRNRGELEAPPAHRVEGFNPLCGDEVVLTLLVDDGRVADIKFAGSGCSISQSSASMMSIHEAALGSDGDGDGDEAGEEAVDVRKVGELAALQGVVKFPVRIKCATLSWNALAQALDEVGATAS